jgi:hypothetical protein
MGAGHLPFCVVCIVLCDDASWLLENWRERDKKVLLLVTCLCLPCHHSPKHTS